MRNSSPSRISPLASGDEALLRASPEERSLEDQDRYIAAENSARLRRWLELQDVVGEAFRDSTDREALLLMGPRQMTPDAASDLTELCVPTRSR